MLRFFIYNLVISALRKCYENIIPTFINPLRLGIFSFFNQVNLLLNNNLRKNTKAVKFLRIVKN